MTKLVLLNYNFNKIKSHKVVISLFQNWTKEHILSINIFTKEFMLLYFVFITIFYLFTCFYKLNRLK